MDAGVSFLFSLSSAQDPTCVGTTNKSASLYLANDLLQLTGMHPHGTSGCNFKYRILLYP